jgi:hypothetical protein
VEIITTRLLVVVETYEIQFANCRAHAWSRGQAAEPLETLLREMDSLSFEALEKFSIESLVQRF